MYSRLEFIISDMKKLYKWSAAKTKVTIDDRKTLVDVNKLYRVRK